MSLEVLKPVSKNVLAHKTLLHEHTIGNAIKIHSQQEGLPSLANVNIAIFGVLDSRKTQDYLGQEFDFDEIRTSFYELFPGNWHLNIADLGDLEKGHSVEDTYAAVTAITKTLLKQNIIPIILGGTILVTMIFSFYIFEESLNYHKLLGTTFIIFGIYLVVITNNN